MHVSQQQVGLIVLRPQHSHFLYLPRTVFKNLPPPTSLASFPPLPSPSLPHSFSPPTLKKMCFNFNFFRQALKIATQTNANLLADGLTASQSVKKVPVAHSV